MTDLQPAKESLVKLLLSAPSQVQTSANLSFWKYREHSVQESEPNDDATKLINYFQQSSGSQEREPNIVMMDHSYCRPWNWRPETSYMRPTKCLFVWRGSGSATVSKSAMIDVTGGAAPEPVPVYDVDKARILMEESEKTAASVQALTDDNCEDWENRISRANWSSAQNRLFSDTIKILDEDRLGRLTYEGSWNEPVLRRNVIDKSVTRTRSLLAGMSWDVRLTQWLHSALLEYLPRSYLSAYLDILQSLRAKLPALVDRMIWSRGPTLRRPWDAGAPLARARPPPQLPAPQPVFVLAGYGGPRAHRWASLLAQLGPVTQAQPLPSQQLDPLPSVADRALTSIRSRVNETRTAAADRPIVLVGCGAGAALALQAADAPGVVCCVCLGPGLLTAEGRRGESEDAAILDTPCPVLFVIGQCAHRCTRELAEDVRERMRVRTGLVIVGSADDHLRMAKSRRRRHGVTQAIVDRCVLDEIAEFIGGVLTAPPAPPPQQQLSPAAPPAPPPVKISRPVTVLQQPQQQRQSINTQIVVARGGEQRTAVKVLDGTATGSTSRRTVDLSKVTLVNTATTHQAQQSHSVFVLADGTRCVRTTPHSRLVPTRRHVTTSARQTAPTPLPPSQPQLTASEILDLPIIFADGDTPLLAATENVDEEPSEPKYVLIDKSQATQVQQQQPVKRTITAQMTHAPPKYARIVFNQPQQSQQPRQVQLEFVDLETELKANTVPKPQHHIQHIQPTNNHSDAN